jgi:hypothetical protein
MVYCFVKNSLAPQQFHHALYLICCRIEFPLTVIKRLLITLSFSLFFLQCQDITTSKLSLTDFIPQNTTLIIKTSEISTLESNLKNNQFLNTLSKTSYSQALSKQLNHLNYLQTKQEILLCFAEIGKDNFEYSLITKFKEDLFAKLPTDIKVETFEYEGRQIKQIQLNEHVSFQTTIEGFLMLSSSKLLIENTIRQHTLASKFTQADFKKIYDTADDDKSFSAFINHENAPKLFEHLFPNSNFKELDDFASWSSLDFDISQDKINISGINASTKEGDFIHIFKNTGTKENHLAAITPSQFDALYAFTYTDFEVLKENIGKYRQLKGQPISSSKDSLFYAIDEIGLIYKGDAKAIGAHISEAEIVLSYLDKEKSLHKEYRNTPIYNMRSSNLFNDVFNPLIKQTRVTYYTILDNFLICAADINIIQDIIANYLNNTTLETQAIYGSYFKELSDESNLLFILNTNNFKSTVANAVESSRKEEINKLKLDAYKLAILQFKYESNFAYLNGLIKKERIATTTNGITQTLNVTLDADIAGRVQMLINHRSKEKDIVVQDVNNMLYLISNTGKVLWKKQLEGRIVGEIAQVDLYRNGRLQMAFATANTFQILDRNGEEVAPFPIKFKDDITQPLSIFDYDKNKNYRFLITQGNEVILLDKEGKKVNGFEFKKTSSAIITAPKHIRAEGKDYIIISEANGKLHILNRRGQSRINVKSNINFSGNEVYLFEDKFSITDIDGVLHIIDLKGNKSSANLNLKPIHSFIATSRTKVSLSDNELSIKDKKVTLDFGLYTEPQLFIVNNKIYISVTDTQSQKVYLFDSNANLLPNFPVYGNSGIDLENIDKDAALEFVVQSEKNAVILYEMN